MFSASADIKVEDACGVDLGGGDLGLEEAQILLGGSQILVGGRKLVSEQSGGLLKGVLDHHVGLWILVVSESEEEKEKRKKREKEDALRATDRPWRDFGSCPSRKDRRRSRIA